MKLRPIATALVMLAFAAPGITRAEDPLEVQIVDALNKAFGAHPGFRANHAKGLVTEGTFKASPAAASLSKAAIFSGASIPVTVRFSDFDRHPQSARRRSRCKSTWYGDQVSSARRQRNGYGDQLAEVFPGLQRRGLP